MHLIGSASPIFPSALIKEGHLIRDNTTKLLQNISEITILDIREVKEFLVENEPRLHDEDEYLLPYPL